MERIHNSSKKILKTAATVFALTLVSSSVTDAGTRLLPPPPPRNHYDEDTVQEGSSFGHLPPERFSALEDEEGRETVISDEGGTTRRRTDRSPAGLEVGPKVSSTNSAPTLRRRGPMTKPGSSLSSTEAARQDVETEKFVTDLNDPISRRKGVQEVAIIAGELGFFPKTFFVSRDVPVRLFVTGASKVSSCLMMDSFNVRKQVRSNRIEEITFTPNQPGTYRFYCPVNGSEGTMVVKELTTSEGSGT